MNLEEAIKWYADQQMRRAKTKAEREEAKRIDSYIKRWEERTKEIKAQEAREREKERIAKEKAEADLIRRQQETMKLKQEVPYAEWPLPVTTQLTTASGAVFGAGVAKSWGYEWATEQELQAEQTKFLKEKVRSLEQQIAEAEKSKKGEESMTNMPMENVLTSQRKFRLKGG